MKNKIITSILLILLGATLVLWLQNRSLSKENVRLETNTETLMSQMETYRNSLGQSVAHVGTLELTIKELKRYREKLEGKSDKWTLKTVWGVGYKFEILI